MDIWTALRIICRNWFVTLTGLGLTAFAANSMATDIKPTYGTRAKVIVSPPMVIMDDKGRPIPQNPLRNLSGNEAAIAGIVISTAQSEAFVQSVLDAGAVRTYYVGSLQSGPIIDINVVAPTAEQAISTQQVLIEKVVAEIARVQEVTGAPPETRLTAPILARSIKASPEEGDETRLLVSVTLLGVALSCSAAFLVEAIRNRWARRRASRSPGAVTTIAPRGAAAPYPLRAEAIETVAWAAPVVALPFRLGPPGDDAHGAGDDGNHDDDPPSTRFVLAPGPAEQANGGRSNGGGAASRVPPSEVTPTPPDR